MEYKHIYIKFVNYNGKRHYFVYENDLDSDYVHEGTHTFDDEQTMYYSLIYDLMAKYGYGQVSKINSDRKNTNTIVFDVWVK